MKKRFFSILLCLCMVLGLLPATALARDDPDFSGLTEGDIVTIDNIDYTYKGEADTSGIQMYSGGGMSHDALTEAYCWKAGSGYVLYNPTVESGKTTSAEVILHNATISTDSATALDLPLTGNMADRPFPVPVTVYVEGTNSLATSDATKRALDNDGGSDTLITGGGTLSLTNSASSGPYSSIGGTVVTIDSGTQVTVSGGSENTIQKLAVTGSDSKLTIVSGTKLNIINICTVDEGAVLENNGTLKMMYRTKDDPGITGEISGSGGIVLTGESETVYCLVDGEFIPYGGDVSVNGLNISGKKQDGTDDSTYNAPTEVTRYKAGENGYALFTPADGGANAKLELNNATINTTSGRALYLPPEPVDITVVGENILTANGSYNFAIDPNMQAVSITGEGSLTLTGNKGIASWDGTAPGVTVHIGGELKINTPQNNSIVTDGDINLSAASITTGIIRAGNGSLTATATTGNLTIDNGVSGSLVVTASNIIMEAPNGEIAVMGKGNTLLDTNGKVDLNAKRNVTLISSENGSVPIYFGTGGASITSGEGSIIVTTDGVSGIEKKDGSEVDGVTLDAAKDITLSAGNASVAASDGNVSITAGGKLSSTSAYGIQVGTLTIKADEVSIAGTQQDGILASSVSITNTDGTNNCKSVSITSTSGSDGNAAIRSSNVTIKADDVLICGNNKAKAIITPNDKGTVTIGDAGMIIGAVSITGTPNINPQILKVDSTGVDASTGLDLSTPPAKITYYKAGDGYALFTPANGEAKATLTLHHASITSGSVTPLTLGAETVIKLEGANSLVNSNTDSGVGIQAYNSGVLPLTIQGGSGDSLIVSSWQCTNMGALTIDGCSVTMNGKCYGILTEGNVVLKNGAKVSASGGDMGGAVNLEDLSETEQYSLTVSDGSTLTITEGDAFITGDLTISGSGSKVTINSGATAIVKGTVKVENSGVLENNGIWQMKFGTTVDEIKALKLTGSGVVRVRTNEDGAPIWATYTNEGVPVKEISNLDLSDSGDRGDLTADGYHWDDTNNTLTLGDVFVSGSLTLPDNTIIKTTSGSTISGGINGAGGTAMHLTFEGTAPLVINGGISLGSNGDTVTVQEGAHVTVNGSLSLGVYDGTLNVIGSGTTLSISSDNSYAALCGEVNVGSGASLTAKAAGSDSVGLKVEKINDASGNVSVSGGSTLTVGCDYGVYVKDGSFTIDESSTFTANADVAAVCVVDTTKMKTQSQTLNVPSSMLPSGTKITDAVGNTVGGGYHYFSIANNASTLAATNESSNPATLTGALGAITLKKASSGGNNNNNGGGSGGGVSVSSYTLTFETNGGTAISSVSKTSGTVVDLSGYKATRDGYDFAGWYSDTALTTKVTSVTLTKSATVYAKWTEKTVQSASPFVDVADSAYYHDAVLWATEKGITSGTTGTTFSPDKICTRAQAVTFLWRAEGSPEPSSANCPFTDVSAKDYYYKAVLWAVEKGIVKGTSPTTFSPSATVTRSQSMTFLWRAAGETTSISANPFADVSKDAYYYNAVLWAVEKDITKGTSDTAFSPDGGCTRAQIVTFLYRYMGK
ncbi:S-layer homology domain-containing protein [Oscillibacter sp.]|uniref:S-layer homology domain-containing protein n=1 Tax=Oscillibacter sp. TaxID=1945593 RepID=UPI0028AC7A9A|nr:S-layer homology domain-containing protein [Oscillibacter sp.]